ncbi:MAG: 4'-phosphopantetheinyl transferase superfamily protein [Pseudomonadota bacterium]
MHTNDGQLEGAQQSVDGAALAWAEVAPPPLPWPEVRQACLPVDDHCAVLAADELALIARAAPRRRASFSSGRLLARRLLSEQSIDPVPALLRTADGAPRWPQGLIGSISHSEQLAWAALEPAGSSLCDSGDSGHSGLGVDIERSGRVSEKLLRRLLTPAEQAAAAAEGRDWTAYFSAKEAIYKALNPLINRYFDFLDVELTFERDAFVAKPIGRELPAGAFASPGQCIEHAQHWWGAFAVPANWAR